jgi:hypothetical protein
MIKSRIRERSGRLYVYQSEGRVVMQKTLTTQAETLNQAAIALDIFLFQVIEQATTLIHHAQQTAPRVVVAFVSLEMVGKVLDTTGQ